MRSVLIVQGAALLVLSSLCPAVSADTASDEVDPLTEILTPSRTASANVAMASDDAAAALFGDDAIASGSASGSASSSTPLSTSANAVPVSKGAMTSVSGSTVSSTPPAAAPSSTELTNTSRSSSTTLLASTSSSLNPATSSARKIISATVNSTTTHKSRVTTPSLFTSSSVHSSSSKLATSTQAPAQTSSVALPHGKPAETCSYSQMIQLLTAGGCADGLSSQKVAALLDLWKATVAIMAIDDHAPIKETVNPVTKSHGNGTLLTTKAGPRNSEASTTLVTSLTSVGQTLESQAASEQDSEPEAF